MDRPFNSQNEFKLAKAAHNWLRVSPLLTLPTLFIVASMNLGLALCVSAPFKCNYNGANSITILIGVIASGLWHLLLLQYVNNVESEYVREHGRKALKQAGIRTGAAAAAVLLDWLLGWAGCLTAIAVIILIGLWIFGFSLKRNVENEEKAALSAIPDRTIAPQPIQRERILQTNPDESKQILEGLQSEDDVAVFSALGKLNALADIPDLLLKQAILKELEHMEREDENKDIQLDARRALDRLRQTAESTSTPSRETGETFKGEPTAILAQTFTALESGGKQEIRKAFDTLTAVNYSSAAVRHQLENLAARHADASIRAEALLLLNSPANRAVQKQSASGKLDRGIRYTLLQEINDWEKSNLLDKQNADAIRRRYDFDLATQTSPAPRPRPESAPAPELKPAAPVAVTPQPKPEPKPVAPPRPQVPPEPRPSLLQTLTSEGAIKIYLYLGAFFVIAAAAILGAVVPELRLPILMIGTFVFGGISVAVKRRLPQPSFALFIVFSFLLPITANSLEETLRSSYNLSSAFTSGYWAVIFLLMSAIWSGGTWLYESRFFSVAAFGALLLAFLNLGNLFDPAPALNMTAGLAVLGGAAGTWLLKKWRGDKFAMPLFLSAQFVQAINLLVSLALFTLNVVNGQYDPPWNLALLAAWGMASVFYILSNELFPFFAFPWLAAGALLPLPWFVNAAFETKALASALILFAWSALLAASSEILRRIKSQARYYLPALLASLPGFALAAIAGFDHAAWLGFAVTLAIAALFTALHILHSRWWLWTLALLNAVIAYFAFFNFDFIEKLEIHGSYVVTLLAFLLLLPDLILPKDWKLNLPWRLPVRIYAAIFTVFLSLGLLIPGESLHSGICYLILAALLAIYALAYRKAWIGYLPALYFAATVFYFLDALDLNLWRPALVSLAVLYYIAGVFIRGKKQWSETLRNSGMILGSLVAFAAFVASILAGSSVSWLDISVAPESLQLAYFYLVPGIWYGALIVFSLLFLVEMRLRRNGLFEIATPAILSTAAYFILSDFYVEPASHYLLAFSLIWLLEDLFSHFAFKSERPLRLIIRIIGGAFAALNYLFLMNESNAWIPSAQFGVYALLFLTICLVYRRPLLLYASTLTLPLAAFFTLRALGADIWLPVITALSVGYYALGAVIRKKEGWSKTLRYSGLIVGSVMSIAALFSLNNSGGWYALIVGLLFIAEMHLSRNGWFEVGAPLLFTLGAFLILRGFKVDEVPYHLLTYSSIWLLEDLLAHLTFASPRPLKFGVRILGGALTAVNFVFLFFAANHWIPAVGFGVYALLFLTICLVYRRPLLLYASTLTLPLAAFFTLRALGADIWLAEHEIYLTTWLPVITALSVGYYTLGAVLRKKEGWSKTLRYSGLIVGSVMSIAALFSLNNSGGWYALIVGLLFIAEMHLSRNGWFEVGAPLLFTLGAFLILRGFKVDEVPYHLLTYSSIWLLEDLLAHLTFASPRPLKFGVRILGGALTAINFVFLFFAANHWIPAVGFGVYALFAAASCFVYRQPKLLYAFTLTLSLFAAFLFRAFGVNQWIYPVIFTAMGYYAIGAGLRAFNRFAGWDKPLLYSGLGFGVIVSFSAFFFGGWGAAIPVAIAASFWAFEAYFKRDVRLSFPANLLYLLAYLIIFRSMYVTEPQYFSVGAALFGLIQHYLLTRAGSKKGAYIMGMLSQFVLLGTTYIEMVGKNDINYFFLLFVQSLIVLVYGIVIRSRSLTFFPIGFVVLGVITVTYSALKGVGPIFVIGCTGILLLVLGVVAVLLRERIAQLGEKLSGWKA